MAFLKDLGAALGSAIHDKFAPGENTLRSLDTTDPDDPDRTVSFGELGDFANKFDRSAERNYIESGFIRNVRPRSRQVLMQLPDMTIVIKKRMFSSLIENFRVDFMNNEDLLFFNASKRLFKNKCQNLAVYERLTKINRAVQETGVVDSSMFSQVLDGIKILENEVQDLGLLTDQPGFLGDIAIPGVSQSSSSAAINILSAISPLTRESLQKARDIGFLSRPSQFTQFFDTGVFEITTVSNASTTVSTDLKGGKGGITIEDPYNILHISETDIDKAIADASNLFSNSSFFQTAEIERQRIVANAKLELNNTRRARGAQPIIFQINPQTVISKKIRPIVDGVGQEIFYFYDPGFFGIQTGGIFGAASPLSDAADVLNIDRGDGKLIGKFSKKLDRGPKVVIRLGSPTDINRVDEGRETALFEKIIVNILQIFTTKETTDGSLREFNDSTSSVRNKMRLHFAGKSLIQPMDVVHVYMSSKQTLDSRLSDGLQGKMAGLNLGQKINDLTRDINSTLGDLKGLFSGTGNNNVNIEKVAIVGPDFPTWLWMMLRNDFTRQAAGTHVFAGLVKGAKQNYDANSGKHTLSVDMEDFASYFDKGQINRKPAADVFNRSLYDPLTPFKINFDKATGFELGETPEFLHENMELFDAGILRQKFGRARGEKVTQDTQLIGDGERSNRQFRKVYNEPDGMVYRWKEGIGSETYTGSPHPSDVSTIGRSPALTKNPFAGQDAMNVLSLLITGEPYNFNTFVKAGLSSGNLTRDSLTNEDPSTSLLISLRSDLSRTNATWGNFVPFKGFSVNERAWKQIQLGETSARQGNDKINKLLRERAKLFDELTLRNSEFALNPQLFKIDSIGNLDVIDTGRGPNAVSTAHTVITGRLVEQIATKDIAIERARLELRLAIDEVNKNQGQLKIIGNDISFDPTLSGQETAITERERAFDRGELRRKVKNLTQRRLWQVKSNEDRNLFIVDDQYDKSYDIQSFERALQGNIEILKSDYTSVFNEVNKVAKLLLGLEVFANTQGHIEARPPAFNKVPSSVFYKMFRDAQRLGKKVFPDFLESLFVNQTEGLIDRIEIVEDEIRLRAAVLGQDNDFKVEKFLKGSQGNLSESLFKFVTDGNTGKIGSKDIRTAIQQAYANPDNDSKPLKGLGDIESNLQRALGATRNFDILRRVTTVNETRFINAFTQDNVDRMDRVRKRLEVKTGSPAKTARELLSNDRTDINARSQTDVLIINNDLGKFISERQVMLKQLSNSIRNLREGVTLNTEGKGANAALYPFLNRKQEIPDILEHMIEDEDNDDLGPGSGGRYIIKEHQIISFTMHEEQPPYTVVEVNGLFGEGDARGLVDAPTSLDTDGGNLATSAFAVDYDLWRMYGWIKSEGIKAPYFSDPEAQCAPFAVYMLNRARADIIRASCEMAGNEFMQPGEVVYIDHKDMLFYVKSVSHNYNFDGGTFTTTLELTYGHTPGTYIPTILDVVGNALYKNRNIAGQYRSVRQGHCAGEKPINALTFGAEANSLLGGLSNTLETLITGKNGTENRNALNNILVATSGVLDPTNREKIPTIELRMYHNSLKGSGAHTSDQLASAAEEIADWLGNPTRKSLLSDKKVDPEGGQGGFTIERKNITIRGDIDLGGETSNSPSSKAWLLARNLASESSVPTPDSPGNIKAIESAMYNHVIDIWVKFVNPVSTVSTNASNNNASISSLGRTALRKRALSEFDKNAKEQLDELLGELTTTGTDEDVS